MLSSRNMASIHKCHRKYNTDQPTISNPVIDAIWLVYLSRSPVSKGKFAFELRVLTSSFRWAQHETEGYSERSLRSAVTQTPSTTSVQHEYCQVHPIPHSHDLEQVFHCNNVLSLTQFHPNVRTTLNEVVILLHYLVNGYIKSAPQLQMKNIRVVLLDYPNFTSKAKKWRSWIQLNKIFTQTAISQRSSHRCRSTIWTEHLYC